MSCFISAYRLACPMLSYLENLGFKDPAIQGTKTRPLKVPLHTLPIWTSYYLKDFNKGPQNPRVQP